MPLGALLVWWAAAAGSREGSHVRRPCCLSRVVTGEKVALELCHLLGVCLSRLRSPACAHCSLL